MIFAQSYIVKKKLGEGGFSKVYLVKNIMTKKLFALKKTQLSELKPENVETLCNEFKILKSISCKNIIECYEIYKSQDGKIIYGVLELAERDVREVIEKLKIDRVALDLLCTINILHGVASGLSFLFDINIVHRDIKPDNVLITHSDEIKISDFGLVKTLQVGEKLKEFAGTPIYAAIEIFSGEGYSYEVDVWAFGCLAYELLMKYHPFEQQYKKTDKFKPEGTPLFPTIQPSMNRINPYYSELSMLIRRCFIHDVNRRITIKECFEALDLLMSNYKDVE